MKTSFIISTVIIGIWFLCPRAPECYSQDNQTNLLKTTEIHEDLFSSIEPELFLPELFGSKHRIHSSPSFSSDMKEVYWSVLPQSMEYGHKNETILYAKKTGKVWSSPQIASFSGKFADGGPLISPDGTSLYFYSKRPMDGRTEIMPDYELWFVERQGESWGEPQHLALDFKNEKIFFSMNIDKDIYFTSGHGDRGQAGGEVDIFFTEYENGVYSTPERLPIPINTERYLESDPLISPDGSYLLFYSFERPENHGQYDLYISYNYGEHNWSTPVNLGMKVNKGYSRFPKYSPDYRYVFFVRPDGVYKMNSHVLSNAGNK